MAFQEMEIQQYYNSIDSHASVLTRIVDCRSEIDGYDTYVLININSEASIIHANGHH